MEESTFCETGRFVTILPFYVPWASSVHLTSS